ncbi:PREDICTED: protein glass [Nicrophorus vespilloides]|uniref:Protein glass n=1 Tax=Nicrophorus vespilloides TaxID=110193 RepID=A0ABM1NHZ5_NICVS|nr:PREDICTED: protein glass [Nicrophorus vespilloides]
MDPSYIPNNPQFGVQLECNWTPAVQNQNIGSVAAGSGTCPSISTQDDLSWTTEDMGSFALPLDLEPLPSLFPFSPCSNPNNIGYKTENQSILLRENKQPSDVADVLLSLKHAVVHPSQQEAQHQHQQQQHIYHPQVLLSPGGYTSTICEQPFSPQAPPMFPSMSVNVSMNMTMHGYHPAATNYPPNSDISYPHQVQWNSTPQVSTPMSCYQTQGLLSPTYGGTTYSFTADFRPPQENTAISTQYKPTNFNGVPPRRRHSIFEEDSQKPNVCRICGKSYARPSTLKTHLRTHSGEKPYRCIDCNKSFSQAANLTAHVRTHSGEKPFRCPVCDRRFSQSSSVTTHMRTHSGERPYRCRLCKKAFSDSSTLTKHLRIHSGEKPYECKLCLLRFSQSGNLNRHMRVHGTANGHLSMTTAP